MLAETFDQSFARTWSTDTVAAPERFAYWREAVCQALLCAADPERPAGRRFAARISAATFGGFGFAAFAASPHHIRRAAARKRAADAEPYLIGLQLSGETHYIHADGAFVARPGELSVLNTARPFHLAFPGEAARLIAIVPRASLRARAPWLERQAVTRVPARPLYAELAHSYLSAVARHGPALDAAGAGVLVDNLAELVALATAPETPAGALPREAARRVRRDALLAHVRRHLADPALAPAQAATALGLTTRTVHRLMEGSGTSFGRFVLEARLDACRRALGDPRQSQRSIAEIAFAWGFNELSHFTRAFKTRFGQTPGECRRGHR